MNLASYPGFITSSKSTLGIMQLLLGMFYMYGMAGAERNFQVSAYVIKY